MALAKFSEDLTRALKEQGTPVESALDSPEDTPCHRLTEDVGFDIFAHFRGLRTATSTWSGTPKGCSDQEPTKDDENEPPESERPSSHFLFGGACLRPHTDGSLGARSVEERRVRPAPARANARAEGAKGARAVFRIAEACDLRCGIGANAPSSCSGQRVEVLCQSLL
ncbi:hypothetical protein AK812_SmicGene25017 [Symbiodinium microadriaticum]|uniref:Uncharacterized protein n=1 Tax=Symbiodinium microadriaticum TaxID=2951 RepID=A0A1Q9DD16_SYMMI|nr:hypothetical protein AK812_SmicGene25017 [Symbiodinium microadriaticum]